MFDYEKYVDAKVAEIMEAAEEVTRLGGGNIRFTKEIEHNDSKRDLDQILMMEVVEEAKKINDLGGGDIIFITKNGMGREYHAVLSLMKLLKDRDPLLKDENHRKNVQDYICKYVSKKKYSKDKHVSATEIEEALVSSGQLPNLDSTKDVGIYFSI